jgi:hypothetical protein
VNVSALVSGYYSEDYIETRLINLNKQGCEIVLVCQAGSAEHEIGMQYGLSPILTHDIPTLYAAWNKAIKAAQGDYLVVANTDDLFYTGALGLMRDELERTGAGICYSDYDEIDGKTITRKVDRWKQDDAIFRSCFVGPMPMWRASIHKVQGYFDEWFTIAGDWEFWARCVRGGERMCYMPQSAGMYLKRGESLEHRNRKQHIIERKRIKMMYGKESVK